MTTDPGVYVTKLIFEEFVDYANKRVREIVLTMATLYEDIVTNAEKKKKAGQEDESDQEILLHEVFSSEADPYLARRIDSMRMAGRHSLSGLLTALLEWRNACRVDQGDEVVTDLTWIIIDFLFAKTASSLLENYTATNADDTLVNEYETIVFETFLVEKPPRMDPSFVDKNRDSVKDVLKQVLGQLSEHRFEHIVTTYLNNAKKLVQGKDANKLKAAKLTDAISSLRLSKASTSALNHSNEFLEGLLFIYKQGKIFELKYALMGSVTEMLHYSSKQVIDEHVTISDNAVSQWDKNLALLLKRTADLCKKSKHHVAGYPLITTLICTSGDKFFKSKWKEHLDVLAKGMKEKHLGSVCLDSMSQLLKHYLSTTTDEVKVVFKNIQDVISLLFPAGKPSIADSELKSSVNLIKTISDYKLDFTITNIVINLMKNSANNKERLMIGLASIKTISEAVFSRAATTEGERKAAKEGFVPLGTIGGSADALNSYYEPLSTLLADVLNQTQKDIGSVVIHKASPDAHKEKDRHYNESVELMKACLELIPRLIPSDMNAAALCKHLSFFTLHYDPRIRSGALDALKRLIKGCPHTRSLVLSIYSEFSSTLMETSPKPVRMTLDCIKELIREWVDACDTTLVLPEGPVTLPELEADDPKTIDIEMLEARAIVLICSIEGQIRRAALKLLSEIKLLTDRIGLAVYPGQAEGTRLADIVSKHEVEICEFARSGDSEIREFELFDIFGDIPLPMDSNENDDENENENENENIVEDLAEGLAMPLRSLSKIGAGKSPDYWVNTMTWTRCLSKLGEYFSRDAFRATQLAWQEIAARVKALAINPSEKKGATLKQLSPDDLRLTVLWRNYIFFAVSAAAAGEPRNQQEKSFKWICGFLTPLLKSEIDDHRRCVSQALTHTPIDQWSTMLDQLRPLELQTAKEMKEVRSRQRRFIRIELGNIFAGLAVKGKDHLQQNAAMLERFYGFLLGQHMYLSEPAVAQRRDMDVLRAKIDFCLLLSNAAVAYSRADPATQMHLGGRDILSVTFRRERFQDLVLLSGVEPFSDKQISEDKALLVSLLEGVRENKEAVVDAYWRSIHLRELASCHAMAAMLHGEQFEEDALGFAAPARSDVKEKEKGKGKKTSGTIVSAFIEAMLLHKSSRFVEAGKFGLEGILRCTLNQNIAVKYFLRQIYVDDDRISSGYFNALAEVLESEELPIDPIAGISVCIVKAGHSSVVVRQKCEKMYHTMISRFFYRVGLRPFSSGATLNAGVRRAQRILSTRLASSLSKYVRAIYSEIASRILCLDEASQAEVLYCLVPWCERMVFGNFGSVGTGAPGTPAKQASTASMHAEVQSTRNVLDSLISLTSRLGGVHPGPLEQIWRAFASRPANIDSALSHLVSRVVARDETNTNKEGELEHLVMAKTVALYCSWASPALVCEKLVQEVAFIREAGTAAPVNVGEKQVYSLSRADAALLLLTEVAFYADDDTVSVLETVLPILLHASIIRFDHPRKLVRHHARQLVLNILYSVTKQQLKLKKEDEIDPKSSARREAELLAEKSINEWDGNSDNMATLVLSIVSALKKENDEEIALPELWGAEALRVAGASQSFRDISCSLEIYGILCSVVSWDSYSQLLEALSDNLLLQDALFVLLDKEKIAGIANETNTSDQLADRIRVSSVMTQGLCHMAQRLENPLKYPHMFWGTVPLLSMPCDVAYTESLTLMDRLLSVYDLSDPEVINVLLESKPKGWKIPFTGLQPLIIRGLLTPVSAERAMKILIRLVKLGAAPTSDTLLQVNAEDTVDLTSRSAALVAIIPWLLLALEKKSDVKAPPALMRQRTLLGDVSNTLMAMPAMTDGIKMKMPSPGAGAGGGGASGVDSLGELADEWKSKCSEDLETLTKSGQADLVAASMAGFWHRAGFVKLAKVMAKYPQYTSQDQDRDQFLREIASAICQSFFPEHDALVVSLLCHMVSTSPESWTCHSLELVKSILLALLSEDSAGGPEQVSHVPAEVFRPIADAARLEGESGSLALRVLDIVTHLFVEVRSSSFGSGVKVSIKDNIRGSTVPAPTGISVFRHAIAINADEASARPGAEATAAGGSGLPYLSGVGEVLDSSERSVKSRWQKVGRDRVSLAPLYASRTWQSVKSGTVASSEVADYSDSRDLTPVSDKRGSVSEDMMSPVLSSQDVDDADKAENWEERVDSSGKPFYFNIVTGVTLFEIPQSVLASANQGGDAIDASSLKIPDLSLPSTIDADGNIVTSPAVTPKSKSGEDDEEKEKEEEKEEVKEVKEVKEKEEKPKVDADTVVTVKDLAIARSWKHVVATDGKSYFYNSMTRESSWKKPADTSLANSTTIEVPEEALKWRVLKTKDGKRVYYFDSVSQETQWTVPDILAADINTVSLESGKAGEAAEKKRLEEEEAEKKRLEEEAAEKKRLEEEAEEKKRLEEEEAEKKRLEEEAAEKKRLDEEAAEKKRLEEEAAEKKRLEEEAAEKKRLEEEAAEKKRLEEEAAEKKRLEEEAAEKKRLEEEAAEKKKLEEEKEEEMKKLATPEQWNAISSSSQALSSNASGVLKALLMRRHSKKVKTELITAMRQATDKSMDVGTISEEIRQDGSAEAINKLIEAVTVSCAAVKSLTDLGVRVASGIDPPPKLDVTGVADTQRDMIAAVTEVVEAFGVEVPRFVLLGDEDEEEGKEKEKEKGKESEKEEEKRDFCSASKLWRENSSSSGSLRKLSHLARTYPAASFLTWSVAEDFNSRLSEIKETITDVELAAILKDSDGIGTSILDGVFNEQIPDPESADEGVIENKMVSMTNDDPEFADKFKEERQQHINLIETAVGDFLGARKVTEMAIDLLAKEKEKVGAESVDEVKQAVLASLQGDVVVAVLKEYKMIIALHGINNQIQSEVSHVLPLKMPDSIMSLLQGLDNARLGIEKDIEYAEEYSVKLKFKANISTQK